VRPTNYQTSSVNLVDSGQGETKVGVANRRLLKHFKLKEERSQPALVASIDRSAEIMLKVAILLP